MNYPTRAGSRRVVVFICAVLVATLVASLIYTIFAIRATQVRNGEILRYVRDCTSPTGTCAKRANAQRSRGVRDVGQIVVLAVACGDRPYTQTDAQIEACVMARLRH